MSARLFGAQMDKWLEEQTALTEAAAKGLAIEAFKRLLMLSPQYSGDFVMNWRITLNKPQAGGPDFTDKHLLGDQLPSQLGSNFQAGSRQAVSIAIRMNDGRLNDFKFPKKGKLADASASIIYFSNASRHDEPYAWKIEDNQIKFRPGNEGSVVRRMLASMLVDYGGELTKQKILSLRNKRLRFGNVK